MELRIPLWDGNARAARRGIAASQLKQEEIRDRDHISFAEFTERLADAEEKINNSLNDLSEIGDQHPDLEVGPLSKRLQRAFQSVAQIVSEVQDTVETVEDEKARVLHLAALGLSVEKLAHELNRASKHALDRTCGVHQSSNHTVC